MVTVNTGEIEVEEVKEVEVSEAEETQDVDLDSELLDDDEVIENDDDIEVDEDPIATDEDETEDDEQDNSVIKSNPVRQLRTVNRELSKKLKLEEQEKARLKQQLDALQAPATIELPPEPDLSDDDINYDTDAFKKKYADWTQKKIQVEQQQQAVKQKEVEQQTKFNQRLKAYEQGKSNYKGIDEAEAAVLGALDVNQQGMIVNYATDPAMLVYALGKNPLVLSQLSAIKDPIEYAIKMREIEQKAKDKIVTKTKSAPAPERTVKGGTAVKSNHDKILDKLRSEGKVTEALQYRRKHGLI